MHGKAVVLHPISGSWWGGVGEPPAEGSGPAGCGLSPGDKSEQDYLLALSAQYQVEHYEDCYDIMGLFFIFLKTCCGASE